MDLCRLYDKSKVLTFPSDSLFFYTFSRSFPSVTFPLTNNFILSLSSPSLSALIHTQVFSLLKNTLYLVLLVLLGIFPPFSVLKFLISSNFYVLLALFQTFHLIPDAFSYPCLLIMIFSFLILFWFLPISLYVFFSLVGEG